MDELEQPTERDRVDIHRADALERLGFDEATAMQLALMPHVDIHRAQDMHAQGCPLALIAEILA